MVDLDVETSSPPTDDSSLVIAFWSSSLPSNAFAENTLHLMSNLKKGGRAEQKTTPAEKERDILCFFFSSSPYETRLYVKVQTLLTDLEGLTR